MKHAIATAADNQFDPVRSRLTIAFIDGDGGGADQLRIQIFDSVRQALRASLPQIACTRVAPRQPGMLHVSLSPNVPADVLIGFDLADRGHYRQSGPDRIPKIGGFRRILVPGRWMVRHLTQDRRLKLSDIEVVAVGSPRIDHLRALMADRPPVAEDAPLRILFAPLHDNWLGRDGQPLSCHKGMAPYLDLLATRAEVITAADPRNTLDKVPVTDELLDADIVVTDCTSLLYEAWALGKPVIFPHWLVGRRLLEKARHSAEAQIYRERIGHHADSIEDMLGLLEQGRDLLLGPGVEAFMSDYLSNWRDGDAAGAIARVLEQMADPGWELRKQRMRAAAEAALKEKDWETAGSLLADLTLWNPGDASLHDRLAQALNGQGKWWQEVGALETATELRPEDGALAFRLGSARQRMRRWQAAAEAYAKAIRLLPKKATSDWHYRLGHALEMAGDAAGAAPAYAEACRLDARHDSARFGIGALHAAAGRWALARAAYRARLAEAGRWTDAELQYRLGMAHDRGYEWAEAEARYFMALALDAARPSWYYRLGFVLERQGRFDEAATAYLEAARRSKTHQPTWFYRAGQVLEKSGRTDEACAAYAAVKGGAALPGPANPYDERLRREHLRLVTEELNRDPDQDALWIVRSTLLEAAGDIPGAIAAASEAMVRSPRPNANHAKRHSALTAGRQERGMLEARLARDCTRPEEWYRYGELLEREGRIEEAVAATRQALLRSGAHMPDWHHRLGLLLLRLDRPDEACAAFREQHILQRPHGTYEDRFENDSGVRFHATLREFNDLLEIEDRTILYEVHLGSGLGCNPLPIFEALLKRPGFEDWRHFWVIDNTAKVPAAYRNLRNVFFATRGSTLYLRLLATCKVLVNNGTFPEWFARKRGQLYLNTWHGTPMKTLGSDTNMPVATRANTTRNFLQATHMIFPNAHTRRALMDGHNLQHIPGPRQLISGYPRNDRLARPDPELRKRILAELKLDPSRPVVLYAPTYRGSWNSPELESEAMIEELRALSDASYSLVFRGHHLVEKKLGEIDLPVATAPQRIDTNELLGAIDVLISDYSSIIYDFMVLKRPVIQYVPDFEKYSTERGLYFDRDAMPGRLCDDIGATRVAIAEAIADPAAFLTDRYMTAHAEYCADDDGQATERTIAFLFTPGAEEEIEAERARFAQKAVVLRTALGTINGVASSAIALIDNLDRAGHPVVLALEGVELRKGEMGDDAIRALERRATVLIRTGTQSLSLEEQWLLGKLNTDTLDGAPEMRDRLVAGFAYENTRIFGSQRFRLAVDHQGYHVIWANILAAAPADHRAIYLHSDMVQETKHRLPNLARIFTLYDRYGTLISVSPSSCAANEAALIPGLPQTVGRYRFVPNGLNKKEILARSLLDEEDPDLEAMRRDPRLKLINLARLSPEKNQKRLIWAVRGLVDAGHDIALYVLGEGPLRNELENEVLVAGLAARVFLLGLKRNPFPFLKAAQCHVLSSDYEGQGIVLLEAMALGVPCVSINIPGPQSVLADGLGVLTEATPEALAEGIASVIEGRFVPRPFDADAYNTHALGEFLSAVGLTGGTA